MDLDPNTTPVAGGIGDLLEQLGVSDPHLKLVFQFLAAQESPSESAGQTHAELGQEDEERGEDAVRQLIGANAALREENGELVKRIEALAAALGACPNCWGEDRSCEECAGQGAPGALRPHRGCFEHYVLPLLRRRKGLDPRQGAVNTTEEGTKPTGRTTPIQTG